MSNDTDLRPFRVDMPDEAIADLRSDRARRSAFPGEIVPAPRSRVEKAFPNLSYFSEAAKGGHFAAWEQPELFATEIRAAFRSLR